MSDKLDFSGFEPPTDRSSVPVPSRPRSTVSAKAPRRRKRSTRVTTRRKRRINISLDPELSRKTLEDARRRRLTLSDLVRTCYREHHRLIDDSWFQSPAVPFSNRSPVSTGRIVHMLYLTEDEVELLDDLAAVHDSSRSSVVGLLLGAGIPTTD